MDLSGTAVFPYFRCWSRMYWLRAEMKPPAEGGAASGSAGKEASMEGAEGAGGGFIAFNVFNVFEMFNELSEFGLLNVFFEFNPIRKLKTVIEG